MKHFTGDRGLEGEGWTEKIGRALSFPQYTALDLRSMSVSDVDGIARGQLVDHGDESFATRRADDRFENMMRTNWRMPLTWLAVLVICLSGSGCAHRSAAADAGDAYDGSLAGFQAMVERFDRSWPSPTELSSFKGAGGAGLRYAHWAAPDPETRAGVAVFFSGRTEFIEKNIYAYQELLDRNYDVWTLDWRGQGLSERLLPDEPDKGHIDSYQTYVRDAKIFIDEVVRLDEIEDGKKILLAHSMGGAIGTLYLLQNPDSFDKAVFSSPLIRLPDAVNSGLIRAGNRAKIALAPSACAGILTDCLWESEFQAGVDICAIDRGKAGGGLIDPENTERYSHDFQKVAEIECWIANSRRLGLGGPTSGWLRASYDATDRIMEKKTDLRTPLLIVGGGEDDIVSNAGQREFCDDGNPRCCRLEIADAGHELLIESEPFQNEFFEAFDAFVKDGDAQKAFCSR